MTDLPPHVNADGSLYSTPAAIDEAARGIDARIRAYVARSIAIEWAATEKLVEAELATWGECAWTARDCLTVTRYPDGRLTVS